MGQQDEIGKKKLNLKPEGLCSFVSFPIKVSLPWTYPFLSYGID